MPGPGFCCCCYDRKICLVALGCTGVPGSPPFPFALSISAPLPADAVLFFVSNRPLVYTSGSGFSAASGATVTFSGYGGFDGVWCSPPLGPGDWYVAAQPVGDYAAMWAPAESALVPGGGGAFEPITLPSSFCAPFPYTFQLFPTSAYTCVCQGDSTAYFASECFCPGDNAALLPSTLTLNDGKGNVSISFDPYNGDQPTWWTLCGTFPFFGGAGWSGYAVRGASSSANGYNNACSAHQAASANFAFGLGCGDGGVPILGIYAPCCFDNDQDLRDGATAVPGTGCSLSVNGAVNACNPLSLTFHFQSVDGSLPGFYPNPSFWYDIYGSTFTVEVTA